MLKFLNIGSALLLATALSSPVTAEQLNLGRAATPDEIAAWNIDVRPDGLGLPVGSGNVADGEVIFGERCASCHGDFGEGVGRWPVLSGGADTLSDDRPQKTIGSYWPYLSTLYDYIHRAMPFGESQSLAEDEIYAIVAYLLYMNDVVEDEDFVLSNENFTSVQMPNAGGFTEDVRPDTKVLAKGEEPCMSECKPEAVVTGVATILDVTPDDESNPSGGID
jgi:S-disulfanyl-L-cysteine oxidoreductase SoxD